LNFDNNYRARNNQNNKNRNRNRNRRPNSGGGGGNTGGTGNAPNRVYESNGPDVKVRGTAQTVAEKYHQLGRDAQSAGDNVMAESYYQHAEHYYRIWASNQPVGQILQAFRKAGDEGFEEEVEDNGDGEGDHGPNDAGDGELANDGPETTGEAPQEGGDTAQNRNFRQRDNRDNRDGQNNRERFRPRWQNRRDVSNEERGEDGNRAPQDVVHGEAAVEHVTPAVAVVEDMADTNDRWEAPSFLTRPTTPVAEETVADAPVPERKPRGRRPKVVAEPASDESVVLPRGNADED
jgi:Domain of unknown function (DUF4167)